MTIASIFNMSPVWFSPEIDPWIRRAMIALFLLFFTLQLLCAFLCKRKRTRFAPMIAMGALIMFIILVVMPIMLGSMIGLLFFAIPPVILFGIFGLGLAWAIFGIAMLIRKLAFKKA